VAATAVAAGVDVALWLTGEGAWLGVAARPTFELAHAAAAADLVETVLAAGSVTVCTQCAARREISEADLRPGVRIAGASAYVEQVLEPDVQALVY
jgi:predicted peroxiredoxin